MTRDLVVDYLRTEGYVPQIDPDGYVVFKCEGVTFLFFDNENDEEFFQLAIPAIYEVTDDNREMVLEACNTITRELKVVKCIVVNSSDGDSSSVWLFCEVFLDRDPKIDDIMNRCMPILQHSRRAFYEIIQ